MAENCRHRSELQHAKSGAALWSGEIHTQAGDAQPSPLLGWSRDVGAIAPGRYADLIAVEGDPLADIRVLEKVAAVIKGGERVK